MKCEHFNLGSSIWDFDFCGRVVPDICWWIHIPPMHKKEQSASQLRAGEAGCGNLCRGCLQFSLANAFVGPRKQFLEIKQSSEKHLKSVACYVWLNVFICVYNQSDIQQYVYPLDIHKHSISYTKCIGRCWSKWQSNTSRDWKAYKVMLVFPVAECSTHCPAGCCLNIPINNHACCCCSARQRLRVAGHCLCNQAMLN